MRRFEYLLINSTEDIRRAGMFKGRTREDAEAYLNELGRDGWEIINLNWRPLESTMAFMGVAKREIEG